MSHTLEWYCEYADANGLELGRRAKSIIEAVDKCDGHCPCKYAIWQKMRPNELNKILCPCEEHKDEIGKTGHCHCCLFYKKEEE